MWTGRLSNQTRSIIQILFPNNGAVFQADSAHPPYTLKQFEEHEADLHLLASRTTTSEQH
jgi:hypothetical protein